MDKRRLAKYAGLALFLVLAFSVSLLPQKPQPYDVTDYGADGTDILSDEIAFQRCLNMALVEDTPIEVYVPDGVYYISETLELYSDTTLTLGESAVLVRSGKCRTILRSAPGEEGGYGQQHNLTIQGGAWDGNPDGAYPGTEASTLSTQLLKLRHSQDITLKNVDFRWNAGPAHLVELLGCRNVTIDRCSFYGHRELSDRDYYKEAIQLDYCWAEREDSLTSPTGDAPPYDGTVCENITVRNCVFYDYMTGIGQHYNYSGGFDGRCRNITIRDNIFDRMSYAAVRLYTMDGVSITGNRFYNSQSGLLVYQSEAVIRDNLFAGIRNWEIQSSGTESLPSRLTLEDNQLTGAVSTFCTQLDFPKD